MKQKLLAEFIGTVFLLATVVGSGIMGETLASGNAAIALLGNTIATGAILVVLILIFGPVSGAHFNPAVSLVFFLKGELSKQELFAYFVVQFFAAVLGVFLAHIMFDMAVIQASTHSRTGTGQWVSEAVATFGLLATILGCVKFRSDAVPYAVGLYITAGYWFTASTSFANPAVTFARSFTDTFSGIARSDVLFFIIAQIVGALIAYQAFKALYVKGKEPEHQESF
jgi:glycerol uptake facilitator-like aquaporin